MMIVRAARYLASHLSGKIGEGVAKVIDASVEADMMVLFFLAIVRTKDKVEPKSISNPQ